MTDETFEETLSRLRLRYLGKARERCAELELLLEQIRSDVSVLEAVDGMRHAFHKFSGSGSTYGFPRVSELGLQGELVCDDVLKRSSNVDPAEFDALCGIVAALLREFPA